MPLSNLIRDTTLVRCFANGLRGQRRHPGGFGRQDAGATQRLISISLPHPNRNRLPRRRPEEDRPNPSNFLAGVHFMPERRDCSPGRGKAPSSPVVPTPA